MEQTLAELEAEGLIARRPDATDRRRTLLELTDAGHRALAEDRGRREGWLAGVIAWGLLAQGQHVLARTVRLLERLTELSACGPWWSTPAISCARFQVGVPSR